MDAAPIINKEWVMPSQFGYEKDLLREIGSVLAPFSPLEARLEDIKTAVSEACLNAMEHGNRLDAACPVTVQLKIDEAVYHFRIYNEDHAGLTLPGDTAPADKWNAEEPRGWGLMFIRSLSDRFEFGHCHGKFYVDITFNR